MTTPSVNLAVTVRDTSRPSIILSSDLPGNNEISTVSIDEGEEDYYYVRLSAPPDNDVRVIISGHSGTDLSPSIIVLNFTSITWDMGQRVTLTAGSDADSSQEPDITLVHTADELNTDSGNYDAIVENLVVTINEVTIGDGRIITSTDDIIVSENGNAEYTVRLSRPPNGDVTVRIVPTTDSDISVDDDELTFTTSDWDETQTVTISAASDSDTSNDIAILAHRATGGGYNTSRLVGVTIIDDDSENRSIVLNTMSLRIGAGETDTYTVELSHPPTGTSPLTVEIGDPDSSIGVSSTPDTLRFNSQNYNRPQTVTVVVEDDVRNGNTLISHSTVYRDDDGNLVSYSAVSITIIYTASVDPDDPDDPDADPTTHDHTFNIHDEHQHTITLSDSTGEASSEITVDTTLPDDLRLSYIVLPL